MITKRFRSPGVASLVVVAAVIAACNGEGASSGPPVPTAPPRVTADVTASSETPPTVESAPISEPDATTTVPGTEVDPKSTTSVSDEDVVPVLPDSTTSMPDEGQTDDPVVTVPEVALPEEERVRQLPDDLGPLLDEVPFDDAPEVSNPGEIIEIYEMGYLYIPDRFDPDEPSALPMRDGDADIVAAYVRARAAIYEQVTVFPVAIEPSDAMQDAFVDGGRGESEGQFTSRNETGTLVGFPFDRPDIYRPYVLAEPRSETSATVWDCYWASSSLVTPDGSVAFEGAIPYSVVAAEAEMSKVDGQWKVVQFSEQEQACR